MNIALILLCFVLVVRQDPDVTKAILQIRDTTYSDGFDRHGNPSTSVITLLMCGNRATSELLEHLDELLKGGDSATKAKASLLLYSLGAGKDAHSIGWLESRLSTGVLAKREMAAWLRGWNQDSLLPVGVRASKVDLQEKWVELFRLIIQDDRLKELHQEAFLSMVSHLWTESAIELAGDVYKTSNDAITVLYAAKYLVDCDRASTIVEERLKWAIGTIDSTDRHCQIVAYCVASIENDWIRRWLLKNFDRLGSFGDAAMQRQTGQLGIRGALAWREWEGNLRKGSRIDNLNSATQKINEQLVLSALQGGELFLSNINCWGMPYGADHLSTMCERGLPSEAFVVWLERSYNPHLRNRFQRILNITKDRLTPENRVRLEYNGVLGDGGTWAQYIARMTSVR